MAITLEQLVQRMIDGGESEEAIAAVIKGYKEEPQTTGFLDTTKEIVKGAARRFLPSTLSGAASAVMALPKAAYNAVTNAPGAVGDIVSDPGAAASRLETNAKGMIRSLAQWPGNIIEDVKAGATDPKAYGESVGESLGAGTGAALAGKYIPIAPKPVMKTVGKGLQYAGEHPFGARLAGGTGIVTGLYKGDPALVLAGATGMAAPKIMTSAGRNLRIAAGESPAIVELGKKGVAAMNEDFSEGMIKRNLEHYDERQAAAAGAAKVDPAVARAKKELQDVRDLAEKNNAKMALDRKEAAAKVAEEARKVREAESMREGTTPKTRYSETVSGTTPEGTKKTAVTTYTPEADAAAENPIDAELRKMGIDPSKVVSRSAPKAGDIKANGGRVSGRQTYSAAEDLATPSAQAAQERLAAQARPTAQALADEGAFAGDRTNNVTPSAQEANNAAMRAEAPPAMPFADRTPEERLLARGGPMNPTPESPVDAELASRLPVESVPASRTSREMSATAGLSREDALALGLNPDNPITKLPPDAIAWLLKQRQARQGAYRANAGMDSIASALMDREQ